MDAIDATTGLPVAPPLHRNFTSKFIEMNSINNGKRLTPDPVAPPEWKDPAWKEPAKILLEVNYDGLPVSEVARNLTELFTNQFDVLLPRGWGEGLPKGEEHNWSDTPIVLRLRNVTASEVFNAMNLLFENNRTPLRWELKLNGRRQIALLRVLQDPVTTDADPKAGQQRRVYFVGDLVGDENTGRMSMADVVKTISDLEKMAYRDSGLIQFHEKAQLLVVTGTSDHIDFIQETLEALRTKVATDTARKQSALNKSKTEEPKSNAAGGSK